MVEINISIFLQLQIPGRICAGHLVVSVQRPGQRRVCFQTTSACAHSRLRIVSLMQPKFRHQQQGTAINSREELMSAYLASQLRESSPYLADQGWHQVAKLMEAAADEIEYLQARVHEPPSSLQQPRRRIRISR